MKGILSDVSKRKYRINRKHSVSSLMLYRISIDEDGYVVSVPVRDQTGAGALHTMHARDNPRVA